MGQQGHIDVADAAAAAPGAGSATYPPGAAVYDAEGEKLGTVSDRQDKEDFLVVHKGRLFGHDAYIPRAAIHQRDENGVHLRVRKDELKGMNQTPLPAPTAPIRHSSGAPEALATEPPATEPPATEPPPLPLAPSVPVPDMGAAAVAATAFAEDAPDATRDTTRDAVAAQDVAAQDVAAQDAAAQDAVAQDAAGGAIDTIRERVGPIAEQVKEQASAVAQQQMSSAAEGLDSAAGSVNAVGERLRENNLGALSQYTDLAAEHMEKAAAWLRTTTPEEIAHDIEDFAKKQPAVFAAGALALGLIGVRFLRSTGQNADEKKND
jgi:hypothetical protein